MEKMEKTIPYLGLTPARPPLYNLSQCLDFGILQLFKGYRGCLWMFLSRQTKQPKTQYSAKRWERSKSNLDRPFGLCSQAHELGCEAQ